jgi:hypothetical protein
LMTTNNGELYKLQGSSCSVLHKLLTLSLLGQNIFLSSLFSNIRIFNRNPLL